MSSGFLTSSSKMKASQRGGGGTAGSGSFAQSVDPRRNFSLYPRHAGGLSDTDVENMAKLEFVNEELTARKRWSCVWCVSLTVGLTAALALFVATFVYNVWGENPLVPQNNPFHEQKQFPWEKSKFVLNTSDHSYQLGMRTRELVKEANAYDGQRLLPAHKTSQWQTWLMNMPSPPPPSKTPPPPMPMWRVTSGDIRAHIGSKQITVDTNDLVEIREWDAMAELNRSANRAIFEAMNPDTTGHKAFVNKQTGKVEVAEPVYRYAKGANGQFFKRASGDHAWQPAECDEVMGCPGSPKRQAYEAKQQQLRVKFQNMVFDPNDPRIVSPPPPGPGENHEEVSLEDVVPMRGAWWKGISGKNVAENIERDAFAERPESLDDGEFKKNPSLLDHFSNHVSKFKKRWDQTARRRQQNGRRRKLILKLLRGGNTKP